MALTPAPSARPLVRLARFGMNTPDAARATAFYASAFGCTVTARTRLAGAAFERLLEVQGGAERVSMTLGRSDIELLEFDAPGRPVRRDSAASDSDFQHLAIVVRDMRQAMQRLNAVAGWTAISSAGPQRLPESSGGATAFKFRDPDGHPLELLEFPAGKIPLQWNRDPHDELPLGIDHSAISVADVKRSVAFFQALGLRQTAQTLNQGVQQSLLDGLAEAVIDVIALAPPVPTPHVELLGYRGTARRPSQPLDSSDTAATRLIFQHAATDVPAGTSGCLLLDPDGHHLLLEAPGA